MVALGDTTLTNTAVPADSVTVCVGKNLNTTLAECFFSGPGIDRPVIGALAELEKVRVNGRSSTGDFFRIQRGGSLGWISTENVAIDCEASKLSVGEEGDVSVLYTSSQCSHLQYKLLLNPASQMRPMDCSFNLRWVKQLIYLSTVSKLIYPVPFI